MTQGADAGPPWIFFSALWSNIETEIAELQFSVDLILSIALGATARQ
ncbi:hypothetical protein LAD77_01115 [Klebsiella pneumoniae]|nr:hypothetical protein [Klebsiella pneumoniae]